MGLRAVSWADFLRKLLKLSEYSVESGGFLVGMGFIADMEMREKNVAQHVRVWGCRVWGLPVFAFLIRSQVLSYTIFE